MSREYIRHEWPALEGADLCHACLTMPRYVLVGEPNWGWTQCECMKSEPIKEPAFDQLVESWETMQKGVHND